jgi:hypothetical protein
MTYLIVVLSLATVACSDDGVDSDEEARRAYLGLDKSIEKSLNLGFVGFNLATNANIDPQMMPGDEAGTLTITGQVDSGASDNKGMRLNIALVDYEDGPIVINDEDEEIEIIYNTSTNVADQPYLNLKLQNYPNGTLTGTLDSNTNLTGVYVLSGAIEGELTLNLTINGQTMEGPNATVVRVVGSTTVVGTATNQDGGTYDINITL